MTNNKTANNKFISIGGMKNISTKIHNNFDSKYYNKKKT